MDNNTVKFADIVNFPSKDATGFSNRYNTNTDELRTILGKIQPNKHIKMTVTKKIDGVSSVVVAFVIEDSKINSDDLRKQIMDNSIKWEWDDEGINFADKDREWHIHALEQYLLPHTRWSQRKKDGSDYFILTSFYTPTQKSIQLPHYFRAEIEDYVLNYYTHVKTQYDRNQVAAICLRTELISGKAEPTSATTWLGHNRKMPTSYKSTTTPAGWSSLLYNLKVSKFAKEVFEKRWRTSQTRIDKLKQYQESGRIPQHLWKKLPQSAEEKDLKGTPRDEFFDTVMKESQEAFESDLKHETPHNKRKRKDKLARTTGSERLFGLLNYLINSQWNSSAIIETGDTFMELQRQQLGLAVLDDYTGIIADAWIQRMRSECGLGDFISTKYPSLILPATRPDSYATRYAKLCEYNAPQGPRELVSHMVHTVPHVLVNGEKTKRIDPGVNTNWLGTLNTDLQEYVQHENGEGFMIIMETHSPRVLAGGNPPPPDIKVLKLKEFLAIPIYPETFRTAFGFWDKKDDKGIVIPNDKMEIYVASNNNETPSAIKFIRFLRAINRDHWYTTDNFKASIRENEEAELWLTPKLIKQHGRSTKPYEPWVITMTPWGVYKNVNGLANSSNSSNLNLGKFYLSDHIVRSGDTFTEYEYYLLWVQYVRNSRVRLMTTPITRGNEETMMTERQKVVCREASLRSYITKPKEEKCRLFLLQYFGIIKFWYLYIMSANEESKKQQWAQMSNIMKQCTMNVVFTTAKKRLPILNPQTKQSRYHLAYGMIEIFEQVALHLHQNDDYLSKFQATIDQMFQSPEHAQLYHTSTQEKAFSYGKIILNPIVQGYNYADENLQSYNAQMTESSQVKTFACDYHISLKCTQHLLRPSAQLYYDNECTVKMKNIMGKSDDIISSWNHQCKKSFPSLPYNLMNWEEDDIFLEFAQINSANGFDEWLRNVAASGASGDTFELLMEHLRDNPFKDALKLIAMRTDIPSNIEAMQRDFSFIDTNIVCKDTANILRYTAKNKQDLQNLFTQYFTTDYAGYTGKCDEVMSKLIPQELKPFIANIILSGAAYMSLPDDDGGYTADSISKAKQIVLTASSQKFTNLQVEQDVIIQASLPSSLLRVLEKKIQADNDFLSQDIEEEVDYESDADLDTGIQQYGSQDISGPYNDIAATEIELEGVESLNELINNDVNLDIDANMRSVNRNKVEDMHTMDLQNIRQSQPQVNTEVEAIMNLFSGDNRMEALMESSVLQTAHLVGEGGYDSDQEEAIQAMKTGNGKYDRKAKFIQFLFSLHANSAYSTQSLKEVVLEHRSKIMQIGKAYCQCKEDVL